ncbi:hypothetical protein HY992_00420 [Candidatus Micrarchaeota archaeon]|nr:hypothetical protein [Candidatus Micrarchaeota archaeon]
MRGQKINARQTRGGNYSFSIDKPFGLSDKSDASLLWSTKPSERFCRSSIRPNGNSLRSNLIEPPLAEKRIARAPRMPTGLSRLWSYLVKPSFIIALAALPPLAQAEPAQQPTEPPRVGSVDTNINKGEKPYYRPEYSTETADEGTGMAPGQVKLLAQAAVETTQQLREALVLLEEVVNQIKEKTTEERKKELAQAISAAKAKVKDGKFVDPAADSRAYKQEVAGLFTQVALELMRNGLNEANARQLMIDFTRDTQLVREALSDARKQMEEEAKAKKEGEQKSKDNGARLDYAGALAAKLVEARRGISDAGQQAALDALAGELRGKPASELTDAYLQGATGKTAEFMLGAGKPLADVRKELGKQIGTLPNTIIDAALQPLAKAAGTPKPAAAARVSPTDAEERLMRTHDDAIKSREFAYIREVLGNPSDRGVLLESTFVSEKSKQVLRAYNLDATVQTGTPIASKDEAKLLAQFRTQLSSETRKALETFEKIQREEEKALELEKVLTGKTDYLAYLASLGKKDYELLKKYGHASETTTKIEEFEKEKEKKELSRKIDELAPQIIGLQKDALLQRTEFALLAEELANLREEVASAQPTVGEEVEAGRGAELREKLETAGKRFGEIKERLEQTRTREAEEARQAALDAQYAWMEKLRKTEQSAKEYGVAWLKSNPAGYRSLKASERLLEDETRLLLKAYEYNEGIERNGKDYLAGLISSGEINKVFSLRAKFTQEAQATLDKFESERTIELKREIDGRIRKASERLEEVREYLTKEYNEKTASEFLKKWDDGLRTLNGDVERSLMSDLPPLERVVEQAVLADKDAEMVDRLLSPSAENKLMYTVTPKWIGLLRARARAIQANSSDSVYGGIYRLRMEGKHPEVNAATLTALADVLEQQQVMFAQTLELMRLALQSEPPNAETVRKQLENLRIIANGVGGGNGVFDAQWEKVVAGMSDEVKASIDMDMLKVRVETTATRLMKEHNLRERTLCSFYSTWHGKSIDDFFAGMNSVLNDWSTYTERRGQFRRVTTQRAALEATGVLVGSTTQEFTSKRNALRLALRNAFGYDGTTPLAGADIDSRFANVSTEGQQKIISGMEEKFGEDWQQMLQAPVAATLDETANAQARQSTALLALQVLVSKYDRTVYGGDVYSDFLALNYDAQYAFLELLSKQPGIDVASLSEEDLRKVGVLLGNLQGIPASHQALLLEKIGEKMLEESPETIDAVMKAVAGYSGLFAQGYPQALSAYYASLPDKIGKLTIDAFALKEEIKAEDKSVVIVFPSEHPDHVQLFYPSAQIALNVPKPIYEAHKDYFNSVIVTSPPDFLRGQAMPGDVLTVERVYFEEDVLKMAVSQPVQSITLPLLLTRLERLAPDWLPPVGALENFVLTMTGAHDLSRVTQTIPNELLVTRRDTGTTQGVGGNLQANWYGGSARLDLRIDDTRTVNNTPVLIPQTEEPTLSDMAKTQDTTTVGSMTVRNMPALEETGGGLVQIDGEVDVAGSKGIGVVGDTNFETLLLKVVNNMAGGAQRAVFVQKQGELYAAYYFERLSNGSFWLADVQTMTFAEQQSRFGFSQAELDGKDKATKLYGQIHPAIEGHEFEVEGCLLLSGEFGSKPQFQGAGAAWQQPAGRGAGEGWGAYTLYGRSPATGMQGAGLGTGSETGTQQEGRVVVGINNVGTPEKDTSDFWSRQRFWTGRVYANLERDAVEGQKLQFEGWMMETQRFQAKFFLGETWAGGEQRPVGGARVDYRTDGGHAFGAGGMYQLTEGHMRTGGRIYYVDPSLANYFVASTLLDRVRAGEATLTGGTPEEEARYVAALGVRTNFMWMPGLDAIGMYMRGVGGVTNMGSQDLLGGAIALGLEDGIWYFRYAEARGAYFETVQGEGEFEQLRAATVFGAKVVIDTSIGPWGVEGYIPGIAEAKYTLSCGGFDVHGSRPELDFVLGGALPHDQLSSKVWAAWGGARLRLDPSNTLFLIGSLEERRKKGEIRTMYTQQAMFGYRTQVTPDSIYDGRLYALAGVSQAYQWFPDGAKVVQVDVQGGLHWLEGMRSLSLNLGGFVWERWAYPDQVTTSSRGIVDDRTYRVGATLTAAYSDRLGRIALLPGVTETYYTGIPLSVFLMLQPYAEGVRFPLSDSTRVHFDWTLNVRLQY